MAETYEFKVVFTTEQTLARDGDEVQMMCHLFKSALEAAELDGVIHSFGFGVHKNGVTRNV